MLTLDVPIALGLTALYAQSAFEILTRRGDGYLDSFAGLVFFLLCGRVFQQKTYERLSFDRDYKSFFPLSVTRKNAGRTELPLGHDSRDAPQRVPAGEERIPLSRLRVGDRVVIRSGELIPADAALISGTALVDYSFVTGESEPVTRSKGDHLYAGGKQVGGAIEVETVKPVSQSYLTSLWNHEAFHKTRADVFKTVTDRVGRWFTLGVIVVAAGTALVWLAADNPPRAIRAFTSVLIVACPCALALAAPFAFGTAQRRLARLGVFLKNSFVIERLARVDAIVLDKTGTLTEAGTGEVQFQVSPTDEKHRRMASDGTFNPLARTATSLTPDEERWIFSLTSHSTHPLSVRINEALALPRPARNQRGEGWGEGTSANGGKSASSSLPSPPLRGGEGATTAVQSFRETPGAGIEGIVAGHKVLFGSPAWLESRGVRSAAVLSRSASAPTTTLESSTAFPFAPAAAGTAALQGSAVHVAIDGCHRGVFVLQSPLRPETERLIRRLDERYEVALLSGDNEREQERFQALFGDGAAAAFQPEPAGQARLHPPPAGVRADGDDGGRRVERRGRAEAKRRGGGGGGKHGCVFARERCDPGGPSGGAVCRRF